MVNIYSILCDKCAAFLTVSLHAHPSLPKPILLEAAAATLGSVGRGDGEVACV